MTQALYLLLALAICATSALQTGMIGALARSRGATEAAWISLLASIGGISLIFSVRSMRGDSPSLPSPLDAIGVTVALVIISCLALVVALQGVPAYLAFT